MDANSPRSSGASRSRDALGDPSQPRRRPIRRSALFANQTESHDVAVRWMGVETMERLVGSPTTHDIGGQMGGGSFNQSTALRELGERMDQ